MSNGELLLHVGTHKTGTTSFQHFLRENEAALLDRSVLALADPAHTERSRQDRFNFKFMSHHFIRKDLVTPARLQAFVPERSQNDADSYEDSLVELINSSHCEKIVGSAESFCFLRTDQELGNMARFLGRIRRRVRFFVVFRQDADWRRSFVDQMDRIPVMANALQAGIPEDQRVTADWYFDKAAIRRFWRTLGELVELDHGQHQDIRVALADVMAISTRDLAFGPWQNVSRPR